VSVSMMRQEDQKALGAFTLITISSPICVQRDERYLVLCAFVIKSRSPSDQHRRGDSLVRDSDRDHCVAGYPLQHQAMNRRPACSADPPRQNFSAPLRRKDI
jgi:hypothetical protein